MSGFESVERTSYGRCRGTCMAILWKKPQTHVGNRKYFRDGYCRECYQAEMRAMAGRVEKREMHPEERFKLCEGGCGCRLITPFDQTKAGRRPYAAQGRCKPCLDKQALPDTSALTDDEIAVLALVNREVQERFRHRVKDVLGLLREAS